MNTAALPPSEPKRALAISNILAFIVMITTNVLSNGLPLNGKTQQQLSAQYENMFTPAGFTFSVWSIIYLFYLGFTVYGAIVLLKRQHPLKDKVTLASPYFLGICLSNIAWLFAWHYEYVALSVAIMLVYLVLLIAVHKALHLALPWKPVAQKLWLDAPISLNLGWICVATIANITAWCVQNRWGYSTFPEATWSAIMVVAGTLLALLYVLRGNNIFVGLIIIWALFGVLSKRQDAGGDGAQIVITTAWVGMGLIFAAIVGNVALRGSAKQPQPQLYSQP